MTESELRLKYKSLKYQYLKKIYERKLSKLPQNCRYNKEIKLPNGSKLNICSFNLEDSTEVDLCYKPEHARPCNAFCPVRTKEQLYATFMEEIRDDKLRATYYKDINLLFWMFPNTPFDEKIEKIPLFKRILMFFKEKLGL